MKDFIVFTLWMFTICDVSKKNPIFLGFYSVCYFLHKNFFGPNGYFDLEFSVVSIGSLNFILVFTCDGPLINSVTFELQYDATFDLEIVGRSKCLGTMR